MSGILLHTCGCKLGSVGESVTHRASAAKFWETCEGGFRVRPGECPYLTPPLFYITAQQEIQGTVPRWPDSPNTSLLVINT